MDDDDRRPFRAHDLVEVVLPAGAAADVAGMRDLLIGERAELAAELGAAVRFRAARRAAPGTRSAAAPRLLVGPTEANPELRTWRADHGRARPDGPRVEIDSGVVVVDGPDAEGVVAAMSLVRTAVRDGRAVVDLRHAADDGEAIGRIVEEVGWTYPSFRLRGIDWADVVARHRPRAERDGGALPTLQRWVAELRDPHTQVRADRGRSVLPYTARADPDGVRFGHVPRWSAAWNAGVRSGDVLESVGDDELGVAALLATSAGEQRTRPWWAGRRALTVADDPARPVELAASRGNRTVRWRESRRSSSVVAVSRTRLASGTGYVRIRAWLNTAEWAGAIEAAFADLAGCPRLIVDLRGNAGGNLVAAIAFRRRFLPRPVRLGSVRFSTSPGALTSASPILGEPSEGVTPWHRPVRFLVDRLSYSATEDALLGLRQLDHVELWGEPTGGGSGRPRTVGLQPGIALHVSTALTFEPAGRCVEGNGLAVDVGVPPDVLGTGAAVAAVDAGW